MSEKRKDNRGRLLKDGESQRNNGQYIYQYKDTDGQRKVVYSWRLVPTDVTPNGKKHDLSLREKKSQIHDMLRNGIVTNNITVAELIEMYIAQKHDIKDTTRLHLRYNLNIIKRHPLSACKINDLKIVDCKKMLLDLHKDGRTKGTVTDIKGVLSAAFKMAVEDELTNRNPFVFSLNFIPETANSKEPLSKEEEKALLDFVSNSRRYKKYFEIIKILLGTGMRIGELCGLTIDNINFDEGIIHITKQIVQVKAEKHVSSPKSERGKRDIPMTKEVAEMFKRLLKKRITNNLKTLDGYTDFVIVNCNGYPKSPRNFDANFSSLSDDFNRVSNLPYHRITPHVFRHTFCTNMQNLNMNPKVLQYVMGHARIDVTMNIYSHMNAQEAKMEFNKMFTSNFTSIDPENMRDYERVWDFQSISKNDN